MEAPTTPLKIDATPLFDQDAVQHASLLEAVQHVPGEVQGKVLAHTTQFRQVLFRVAAGDALPRHLATCDVTVTVIEGTGTLTLDDDDAVRLAPGVHVFMPADEPHAVTVAEDLLLLATFGEPEAGIRFT